jgi:transposase
MLKYGHEYVEKGVEFYEQLYQKRREDALRKKAKQMGFELVPQVA